MEIESRHLNHSGFEVRHLLHESVLSPPLALQEAIFGQIKGRIKGLMSLAWESQELPCKFTVGFSVKYGILEEQGLKKEKPRFRGFCAL